MDDMNRPYEFDDDDDRLDDFQDFLGSDEDFLPDDFDLDQAVAGLNEKIDAAEKTTSIASRPRITPAWKQLVASAAAVVLVVGTAYVGVQTGLIQLKETPSGTASSLDTTTLLSQVNEYESELYALADIDVQVLLQDAVAGDGTASTERLLGDLTEDELEYLEANFDVGDLL